jgi:signal transduction histidine kinase
MVPTPDAATARRAEDEDAAISASDFTKRLEHFQRREALRSRFLLDASHELRTPLSVVLGIAKRLEQSLAGAPPEVAADLELLVANAQSLHRHADDLVEIAGLDERRLRPVPARVDLPHLLRRTMSLFEHVAAKRRIRFEVHAPEPFFADVDAEKIERAFTKILADAVRHVPDGGAIRCTLELEADGGDAGRTRVTFEDDGPPETRGPATALGLAIAKEIVLSHGGTFALAGEAQSPVRVVIELPSLAPTVSIASAPAELPSEDARPLVLVVEDNGQMVRFLRLALGSKYRVFVATDGQQGLSMAGELKPDLVITDLVMPGLDGESLVRAMRARPDLEGVPVLVLTADTDEVLRVRVLENGAQDYLTKPFAVAELLARADLQIGIRRARSVLERELSTRDESIEKLAGDLVKRGGELRASLLSMARARERAEDASAQMSRFLGVVTHELRTPLSVVKLGIHIVRRDPTLDPVHAQRLQRCDSSLQRLQALIESLLEHSRMEGGMRGRDVVPFDLGELVRELVEEVRPLAEARGLCLDLDVRGRVPLTSDPHLIRLVASNLVANALKYTDVGGIGVRVTSTKDGASFEVSDTGRGIPASEHGRIFEAFTQLDVRGKRHAAGIGLGLALVREMTALLGGRVELRSEVGKGSAFSVILPDLAGDRQVGGQPRTAGPSATSPQRRTTAAAEDTPPIE